MKKPFHPRAARNCHLKTFLTADEHRSTQIKNIDNDCFFILFICVHPVHLRLKFLSLFHFRDSIARTASAAIFALAFALLAGSAISQSTTAAMLAPKEGEAAGPKDWPADPTKHQLVIKRETTDAKQSAMITAAEAAQAPREALHKAALEEVGQPAIPQGDKVWWYQEKLGIRIPYSITSDAITYFTEIVATNAKKAFKSYALPSSSLDYHASVKFHKEFKLDDKTFMDVNVVTLKLSFTANFTAEATAGLRFEKTRVVVLDAANKVIHVSGDGPTETKIMMM